MNKIFRGPLNSLPHLPAAAFLATLLTLCRLGVAQTETPSAGDTVSAVKVGEQAPAFTLPGLRGKSISLADYRFHEPNSEPGKNVAIVFVRAHW